MSKTSVTNIEREKTALAEQPFTRESARIFLETLSVSINTQTDPIAQKSRAAAELKALNTAQLNSLNASFTEALDLPEGVKKAVESVNLRSLILEEARSRREQLKRSVMPNSATGKSQSMEPAKTLAQTWLPQSANPLEWNSNQIAAVSTATAGLVGIYALWRWFHKPKQKSGDANPVKNEAPVKSSILRKLAWIPGIGLLAAGVYYGHQYLKKFEGYAKTFDDMQKKVDGVVQWGKDILPFSTKKEEEKKYAISEEQRNAAEKSYRKTRGKDLAEIRMIFGVLEGEETSQYQAFIKDMAEKYATREVNGVIYARADVALSNYEESLEVGLKQVGQWIENHSFEIGLLTVALMKTELLSIKDVISSGLSIGERSAKVAASLAKMSIKHPLISVFAVGSTFVAMKAAVMASKHFELPENFQELGNAFSKKTEIIRGEGSAPLAKQIETTREGAIQLAAIGSNFGVWIGGAIEDFGKKVLNAAPDTIGYTQEEVMKIRHEKSLNDLENWITNSASLSVSSTKAATEGKTAKFDLAQKQLEAFRKSLIAERLDSVTTSDQPQKLLEELKTTLKELGVELETSGGIVRWKTEGKEQTDLCVDPSIKDKKTLYNRSKEMHEGEESNGSYIFFRAIQHLREKEQNATENAEGWGIDNKIVAMVVGNLIYFTDPDNHWEFWTAPLSIGADLFGTGVNIAGTAFGKKIDGKDVVDTTSNFTIAATNAALISLSAGVLARIKRFTVGGGNLLNNPLSKYNWKATIFGSINPIASPFKLVRDVARGAIDIETFWRMGGLSENGGRYFNTLLARGHIRPEWIGMIEHPKSIAQLKHVGEQVGLIKLNGLTMAEIQIELREHVQRILRDVDMRDVASLKSGVVGDFKQMYKKAAEWYAVRSRFSKLAGGVSKAIEVAAEPFSEAYKFVKTPIENKVTAALNYVKTAKGAMKVLKVGGRLVPFAAPAYEAWMYGMYEAPALQKELDATSDPIKREVIQNEMWSKRVSIELGALGSIGAITLPGAILFAGNIARQQANESINEGTRYMLQDRRDMKDKSSGNLLHQIEKSAPGKKVTWGQWFASTRAAGLYEGNITNMSETFDTANSGTRSEAYAAYFAQNAVLTPLTADMLTKEEAKDPKTTRQRIETLNKDQAAFFTQSALSYIAHVTNNSFVSVGPEILHCAEMYAYRSTLDWRLGLLGQKPTFRQLDWAKKDALISEGVEQEKASRIDELNAMIENGGNRNEVIPFFVLHSMKEELVACEAKILGTNFSDYGELLKLKFWNFNVTNDEEMQRLTRASLAEKIHAALQNAVTKGKTITKESFESARQSILTILKTNPDQLALEVLNGPHRAELEKTGENPGLISRDGLLGYLQENPFVKADAEKKAA